MLNILRKKGVSKRIIWVIVILIILSFGLFGTAYLLSNGKTERYAGQIYGKNITVEDYNKSYQDVNVQAIIRYGDKFSSIKEFLNLESETWDRLILLEEARKRNIKVSDKEVIEKIETYPFFQRDGQFDSLLYNDILKYVFHLTPRDFEENTRETLKLTKMFDQESQSVTVNEQEVMDAFQNQNQKVQVSYILISPNQFKNKANVTEEDLKKYYEEHKNDFTSPPSINVEYLTLNYPAPKPDEKTDSPETETAKKAVRDLANAISQSLAAQPDLKKAAEENKLELKTTGLFSLEHPDMSLGWSFDTFNQLFSLKQNDLGGPYETSTGLIIVKVIDKKDSFIPEYEQVKDKVKENLVNNIATTMAKQKAQEVLPSVEDGMKASSAAEFSEVAKNLGLNIEQTPLFTRGQYLPKIGLEKGFQDAAFALTKENKLSKVIETQSGPCILHLDQVAEADKSEFDKQKEKIAQDLTGEKRLKFFSEFITGLRLKANLVNNLDQFKQ
jgi:peptidyl-prolyl cis-trans isomerase D